MRNADKEWATGIIKDLIKAIGDGDISYSDGYYLAYMGQMLIETIENYDFNNLYVDSI